MTDTLAVISLPPNHTAADFEKALDKLRQRYAVSSEPETITRLILEIERPDNWTTSRSD